MNNSITLSTRMIFIVIVSVTVPIVAQEIPALGSRSAPNRVSTSAADKPVVKKTDAERIVEHERKIEETKQQLGDLKAKLEDPQSEYAKAKAEFTELDSQLTDKKKQIKQLQEEDKTEQTKELQSKLETLAKTRNLAKERFDLAIQEQNTLKNSVATLEKKLQQEQEALTHLQAGSATRPTTQTTTSPEQATETLLATQPSTTTAVGEDEHPPAKKTVTAPADHPATAAALLSPEPTKAPSPELAKAQDRAEAKKIEAQKAEAELTSIDERLNNLQTELANERKLLNIARKKAQIARELQDTLRKQYQKGITEGISQDEIRQLWDKITEAEKRSSEAQEQVRTHMEQIDKLNADMLALQTERIRALEQTQRKRKAAEAAEEDAENLENPFHPENMKRWALEHGPTLAGILIGMFALLWVIRIAENRMVYVLAGKPGHGQRADRENRAKTLTSVFRNAAYIAVIVGGVFMILKEIEIDITPLLGGAAVVGLAVAFGAQNLVKDYFYGFIILMENQYTINDVIRIGDTAGLVERITLRVTVLRDLEGVVHFVPHGEACRVSNLTHGWSRTVLDIGVSYREDADHVMQVLTEVGKELYGDEKFGALMLEAPEILGLDAFGDSAIVIKLIVKTKPLQQWAIKREYLRRIKKRFDEVGIEIPFPHRTIYHRTEQGQQPPTLPGSGSSQPTDL